MPPARSPSSTPLPRPYPRPRHGRVNSAAPAPGRSAPCCRPGRADTKVPTKSYRPVIHGPGTPRGRSQMTGTTTPARTHQHPPSTADTASADDPRTRRHRAAAPAAPPTVPRHPQVPRRTAAPRPRRERPRPSRRSPGQAVAVRVRRPRPRPYRPRRPGQGARPPWPPRRATARTGGPAAPGTAAGAPAARRPGHSAARTRAAASLVRPAAGARAQRPAPRARPAGPRPARPRTTGWRSSPRRRRCGRQRRRPHGPAPAVRDCGLCRPRRGVIEAFARIAADGRLRALAFRLELGADSRWRCAALDIGPAPGRTAWPRCVRLTRATGAPRP